MNAITYELIHNSLNTLDLDALGAATGTPAGGPAHLARVVTVYTAVRPILAALAAVPLVPPQFRAGLTLFLSTFDSFAENLSPSGDFKAGKDL